MKGIKRPLLYMVVALVIGELAALNGLEYKAAFTIWIIILGVAVAICYGLFLFGKKVSLWNCIWLCICYINLLVGFVIFDSYTRIYERYDIVQYGEENCYKVEGVINNIVDKTYGFSLELNTVSGIVYIAVENVENLTTGMQVVANGQIDPMERADNPGNYDEYSYLRSNGVILKLKADTEDIVICRENANTVNIQGWLYELRCNIKYMLSKICTERELGLLSAMVIGEKSDIDSDIKELYSTQGIAHVLAISGLHISVIGMGIYKLLRRKMWYLSSATVGAVVMICFSFMTGNSVSAVRAVVMFVLHVTADILGRKYDMLSSLSLSAILLLWDNPYYITNGSFLLSYAAMVAVSVAGPIVIEFVAMKNVFINSLLFNISLTFTSLPINSCLFYRLSTYSILLNLLVVPLMSIVLLMSILGVVAGFVFEPVGVFFIGTAVYILRLYEALSGRTANLPFSSVVTGGLDWEIVVVYYLCLGLILLLMKYGYIIGSLKLFKLKPAFEAYIKPICWVAVTVLMSSMIIMIYAPKQEGFKLCFLDVGQGDCAYIHSETGVDYLIDGGSSDERDVGRYKIESFLEYMDVDILEYVFISHCDTDHISGIVELIERGMIGIENLVLPVTEQTVLSENALELVSLAQDKGIQVLYFGEGDSLVDGDIELYCVSPKVSASYGDINEASMVLLMKCEQLNCVFTGDIGIETEKQILKKVEAYFVARSTELPMVLKVPHHGSNGSSGKEFLEMLSPDIAVISCGEDNSYGHPHKETLQRLQDVGSEVVITFGCGAIAIENDEKVKIKLWKNGG
ncbi:MAG: DNA internalization-related competence protein ComEC/Rec2 [Lachnospiraceae bacterium]|nr:DNA internalization-related competence protein ComEC/Rec2 [Lachnospiraceae bacterium]